MAIKYIGNKRAKVVLKEVGSSLKRAFHAKMFDGKLYLFSNATFSKKHAEDIATNARARKNGKARITKDGKLFLVWERY